jgi:DNA-binding NtrC family response regulator
VARRNFTKGYIEAALQRNNYNMIATSEELGMTDRNLRKLKKLLKIRPET